MDSSKPTQDTKKEVSDKDLEVLNKAQQILDTFLEKMKNIEIEPQYNVSRQNCLREELDKPSRPDAEFIEKFLNNAPNANSQAIITKKGEWTK